MRVRRASARALRPSTGSETLTARFRDAQAPSVSSLTPGSGIQQGTFSIGATASDNSSVARVDFTVRGARWSARDTTAPYSVSFNSAGIADGTATLRATAVDSAGNASHHREHDHDRQQRPGAFDHSRARRADVRAGHDADVDIQRVRHNSQLRPMQRGAGGRRAELRLVFRWKRVAFGDEQTRRQLRLRGQGKGRPQPRHHRRARVLDRRYGANVSVTKGPKPKTTRKSASFSFEASEPDSTFECSLDGGAFKECFSPQEVQGEQGQAPVLRCGPPIPSETRAPATLYKWRVLGER